MIVFFISVALLMALTAGGDPNSSALALEQMGEKAGLAASVYGTIFFFLGSGIGAFISSLMSKNALPLGLGAFILSAIALALFYSDSKKISFANQTSKLLINQKISSECCGIQRKMC